MKIHMMKKYCNKTCDLCSDSTYASGSSAPTPTRPSGKPGKPGAGPSRPTPAPAPLLEMTQTVTFTSLGKSAYKGDLKRVYETGYGVSVGLYIVCSTNMCSPGYKPHCSVTSEVSTRRALKVAFTAKFPASEKKNAQTNAKDIAAGTLAESIAKANTALGKNVTAPTAAQISHISVATVTNDDTSSSALAAGIIAVIVIGCILFLCCPIIVLCFCCWGTIALALGIQQDAPTGHASAVEGKPSEVALEADV